MGDTRACFLITELPKMVGTIATYIVYDKIAGVLRASRKSEMETSWESSLRIGVIAPHSRPGWNGDGKADSHVPAFLGESIA